MDSIAAVALSMFFLTAGSSHFVFPEYFRSLVPSWLGPAGLVVAAGGAAEVLVGVLILAPPSRSVGAWSAAGLITVYLVSHIDALRHAHRGHPSVLWRPVGVAARLAVNLGYIGWAVAVALAAA